MAWKSALIRYKLSEMNLKNTILGLKFSNPIMIASGKWAWNVQDWEALVEAGAGGITTKSFWNHEHKGNPEPTVVQTDEWTLNAVGLPDHGPEHSEGELKKFLPAKDVPLIVSILGMDEKEYADNARRIAPLKPSAFEINISSPTFLKLKGTAFDAEEAVKIVPAVKKEAGDIPVFVKLSPNIPDIGAFAVECIAAGADGISAINTLGTGVALDPITGKSLLSAKRGGLSGPGIKPLALRCVCDVYEATNGQVPIIGIGGVMTGEDVIDMMRAGASLVGLATAVLKDGPKAVTRIQKEFVQWCTTHNVENVADLIGQMHH